tara:strand:+ start:407 stop:1534 length:1128 start_codon:yes stop_codon:yes gene_type:complete
MNKLIFRKLYFDIFTFFILSCLAITSIVWVAQGVNLLDIVTEQGHSFRVYFVYLLLSLPKIFSKLIIFAYFLSLFIVISRYENNNEILVFWINGIKKITFVNFIFKVSFIFVIIQLLFNLLIVPYTQNLAQSYLKSSSIDFFPKLIQEKKFSRVSNRLNIFVEKYEDNGLLKGIYIKENLKNGGNKIIIARKGKLNQNDGYNFQLYDGKIINLDKSGNFNLGFAETTYQLSDINFKTRKGKKLGEIESSFLFYCLKKNINNRKNNSLRCGEKNSFLIKDIYEEVYKRIINPIYIIILSLISSLVILKAKIIRIAKLAKFLIFFLGFAIIVMSELTYKLINLSLKFEVISLLLPIILILIFYFYILIKSNFRPRYL